MDEADLGPRLTARLTYRLKRALLDLEELHAELLAPTGVTVRELAVLLLLDDSEPGSQQEVASRLGVDRTSMVALLDTLEDKGLVARRPDPADRRRNVVEITEVGRASLREAMAASDEAERRLLDDLSRSESRQLRDLLARTGPGRAREGRAPLTAPAAAGPGSGR